MYLICLPNNAKANLEKANVIMAKNLNDVPLSKKGATIPLIKKADLVYDNVYQNVQCDYAPVPNLLSLITTSKLLHFSNPYIESPGKPPNAAC
jgi:hypothetical protein